MHYTGGYYLFREPFVRAGPSHAHTSADLTKIGQYAIEAVNHIQNTPWEVNPFILDLAKTCYDQHRSLANGKGETVLRTVAPTDPKDPFSSSLVWYSEKEWEAMSAEDRAESNKARQRVYSKFDEDMGVYMSTLRTFNTAEEMGEFDKFYFPHNMDFRTRIYPIPSDLTPQGNDFSKGLLRFHRGTRLGAEGLYWLEFMVATHWGMDKLHPNERVEFAKDFYIEGLYQFVDGPLDNLSWLDADKPFQFLAAAHEYVWAMRSGDPEAFVSKLPGNLDGSCNGAQHLSIMTRDLEGATATNCRSIEERFDLYMEVADKCHRRAGLDAKKGIKPAVEMLPKLEDEATRRKIVKRAVMTVPYGVTEYGVADFMMKDKHVEHAEDRWSAAKYMRDQIMDAVAATLSKGRELQNWFQKCAIKVADAGMPLQWDTPAGTKVTQAYRNMVEKRITVSGERFSIYAEPEEGEAEVEFHERVGMDVEKMGTAAPPNVVHSCDASHLQITVCRMAEAGIRDFSMIHDSFGCPMAYVGLMRDILRKSIVDMYSGDYLQQWKTSVENYSGVTLPEPPELGEFDINEILDSTFFFS